MFDDVTHPPFGPLRRHKFSLKHACSLPVVMCHVSSLAWYVFVRLVRSSSIHAFQSQQLCTYLYIPSAVRAKLAIVLTCTALLSSPLTLQLHSSLLPLSPTQSVSVSLQSCFQLVGCCRVSFLARLISQCYCLLLSLISRTLPISRMRVCCCELLPVSCVVLFGVFCRFCMWWNQTCRLCGMYVDRA